MPEINAAPTAPDTSVRQKSRAWRLCFWLYLAYGAYALVLPPLTGSSPWKSYGDSLMQVMVVDAFRAPGRLDHDYLARHALAGQPPLFLGMLRLCSPLMDGRLSALLLQALAGVASIAVIWLLMGRWFPRRPMAHALGAMLLLRMLPDHYLLPGGTPRAFLLPLGGLWLLAALRRSPVAVGATNALLAFIYPSGFLVTGGVTPLLPFLWGRRRPWPTAFALLAVCALLSGLVASYNARLFRPYGPLIDLRRRPLHEAWQPDGRLGGQMAFERLLPAGGWAFGRAFSVERSPAGDRLLKWGAPSPRLCGFTVLLLLCAPAAWRARRRPWRCRPGLGARHMRERWGLLLLLSIVSYALFAVARACMLHLYLPSRALVFAGLFVPAAIVSDLATRAWRGRRWWIPWVTLVLFFSFGRLGAGTEHFPEMREAIAFLRDNGAPGAIVAGEPDQMDEIAILSRRPVVACMEMSKPFYSLYWEEYERRLQTSCRADLTAPRDRYGAKYLLIDRRLDDLWRNADRPIHPYEPQRGELRRFMQAQPAPPAWQTALGAAVFDDGRYIVLDLDRLSAGP
jgi:hypothetical protein